jgi:hypothetical protein
MSPPSPKKKNGGSGSGQRQIRFVATDGQPQTKRRRVNAAYVERASPARDNEGLTGYLYI